MSYVPTAIFYAQCITARPVNVSRVSANLIKLVTKGYWRLGKSGSVFFFIAHECVTTSVERIITAATAKLLFMCSLRRANSSPLVAVLFSLFHLLNKKYR